MSNDGFDDEESYHEFYDNSEGNEVILHTSLADDDEQSSDYSYHSKYLQTPNSTSDEGCSSKAVVYHQYNEGTKFY